MARSIKQDDLPDVYVCICQNGQNVISLYKYWSKRACGRKRRNESVMWFIINTDNKKFQSKGKIQSYVSEDGLEN